MTPRIYDQKVPSQLREGEYICTHTDPERERNEEVIQAIKDITDDLYSTLLEINADENIPIQRTNGQRSKENHGNQAQDEAMKRIRNMIQATGWVSGKWIWRLNNDEEVDRLWKQLAPSVVDGPLSKAGACAVKVTLEKEQYLFSLFLPNAFDVPSCTSTLQALVSLYGIIPTGVKTDAFTCAGINSRHPSRIDTLVLRPKDVEGGLAKIQQLKAEFDQHEAIFGPGSRANDELVPLDDAALDLGDLDAEEPINTGFRFDRGQVVTPQTTSSDTGMPDKVAPGAPKKLNWADALGPPDSASSTYSHESPLKLMRHVDYEHLKPRQSDPSTPRRKPLINFQDTSPSPLTSAVSSILRTPVTASGIMRHYDFGPISPLGASNSGIALRHNDKKPLVQLHADFGLRAPTDGDGRSKSTESKLARRSRMMRL